ncbi:RNA polymerase sigma factor [Sphingobacterium faecale]|uniref:RNA polymerase sigma-70 factor n=1 Tax=Sphingobacterium faecale TaxID=2803775 RepID=A0ABS1R0V6_9SPHI|nr:RNA polymerase sigma-70 factor [Sphingobacterium faecale]MBL1407531.1 RNA polymerase sigma-70 factor [Sphingobacterium faecale]
MTLSSAISERKLLHRLKEGDQEAFSSLYTTHHDALYLYAYRLAGDEDQAADFVQEAFMYIWEKKALLHIETSLIAYLFRAVRHRFLNLKAHDKVRADFAANFQRHLDQSAYAVDRIIEEKELFEQLQAELAKLPQKMAQIFRLRQQNIPDREIAEQLGISEKTVKNLMSQTLKKLAHTFKRFVLFLFA